MENKIDYEELVRKLAEAEDILEALRNQEVDAIVGKKSILMVRLKETEDHLKKQRVSLETLVRERDKLVEDLKIHQVELEVQAEDLRRAQQEAQESRDKYLDLFDYAPVGYLILAQDSTVLDTNLTAAQLLDLERSKLTRSPFTKFITSDSQDTFYYHLNQTFETETRQKSEIRIRRKDGSDFYAQLESIVVHSEGKPDYVRTSLSDITERKKAEEALARAKDELEVKVKERTEQLQEAYDEIMQSQKALIEANKQLKQYARKITQVQEEEKKRIAFELHDDTAQYLSILKMQIGALVNSEKIQSPEIKEKLQFLERDADRAFNDVRRYSHELRPVVLENQGLLAAVEQIADDYNKLGQLSIEVNVEGAEPELAEEVKLGFFRIAQEALNNVRKHSQATQVVISLTFQDTRMEMSVSDNGTGFDVKAALNRAKGQSSLGLLSMRERAKIIGADLKIESKPGNGTRVTVQAKI